jgi:catechol 2,3-dioxygenase-like lactoylglutathione lyase family enzyme
MAQSLKSVNVITLFVADEQRSKEFYERAFDVVGVDEGHGTVILQFDNLFLRLLRRDEAQKEMLGQVPVGDPLSGPTVQLACFVDDTNALCADLAERGVSIVYGPVDRPWGVRSAGFRDPDGHVWQFGSDIPED